MPELQPHQQRMIAEYERIKEDHAKLQSFIETNPTFGTLDIEEQSDMNMQCCAMYIHSMCLYRRIGRFEVK